MRSCARRALDTLTPFIMSANTTVWCRRERQYPASALTPNWTARLEYLYSRFGRANVLFPSGDRYASSFDLNTVRLGLTRKIGEDGNSARGAKRKPARPTHTRSKGSNS